MGHWFLSKTPGSMSNWASKIRRWIFSLRSSFFFPFCILASCIPTICPNKESTLDESGWVPCAREVLFLICARTGSTCLWYLLSSVTCGSMLVDRDWFALAGSTLLGTICPSAELLLCKETDWGETCTSWRAGGDKGLHVPLLTAFVEQKINQGFLQNMKRLPGSLLPPHLLVTTGEIRSVHVKVPPYITQSSSTF